MGPSDPSETSDAGDHAELLRRIEESRVRYRVDELVGMTTAEARAVVEGAGGMFATDDEPLAAMFSTGRVVASIADGRVTGTNIG